MKHLLTLLMLAFFYPQCGVAEGAKSLGQQLVESHCISCHASSYGGDGSVIYTRDYPKVRSMPGLKAQVTNCNTMLNLKWFDDEEQQVVLYLNQRYYHF